MLLDLYRCEFQGLVRNIYAFSKGEDFDWESQSDLGIILPGDLAIETPPYRNPAQRCER